MKRFKVAPILPTAPSTTWWNTRSNDEGHNYVLVHWCDTINKWKVSPHRFILTRTSRELIGQFITSTWFDCYIYPGKTFLVIRILKDDSLETLVQELNKGDMKSTYLTQREINAFVVADMEKQKKGLEQEFTTRMELVGSNPKNTLTFALRRSSFGAPHPISAYLPNILFKN